MRPNTLTTLQTLSRYFELAVFTASHRAYAETIVNYLDPQRSYIQHVLSRENCHNTNQGFYIKVIKKNRERGKRKGGTK